MAKLQAFIDERLYITEKPSELDQEMKCNYCCIGGSFEQVSSLSLKEWKEFIGRLIEDRQRQLSESPINIDLVFYCYHDDQAGQLRFNVISSAHSRLPFGCKLEESDLDNVLKQFLRDEFRGFIPMEHLTPISQDEAEMLEKEEPEFVLKIYVQKLKKQRLS